MGGVIVLHADAAYNCEAVAPEQESGAHVVVGHLMLDLLYGRQ